MRTTVTVPVTVTVTSSGDLLRAQEKSIGAPVFDVNAVDILVLHFLHSVHVTFMRRGENEHRKRI